MSEADQALCFLAGANSIFAGDKLLTTPNPDVDRDHRLFERLGLTPRPGRASRRAWPDPIRTDADPLAWIDDESAAWAGAGLTRGCSLTARSRRTRRVHRPVARQLRLERLSRPRRRPAGRRRGAPRRPRTFGWGAGASPLVSGWTDAHQALAEALARVRAGRGRRALPDRVRREPRDDRRPGRAGRRGLLRSAQPRLPDRRRPALRGATSGSTRTTTSTASAAILAAIAAGSAAR